MGFEDHETHDLYSCVAGIMHMGEMKFKQRPREEQAEPDGEEGLHQWNYRHISAIMQHIWQIYKISKNVIQQQVIENMCVAWLVGITHYNHRWEDSIQNVAPDRYTALKIVSQFRLVNVHPEPF